MATLRAPPKPECEIVMVNKTVLAMCMATALLAGCKAKDTAAEAAPEAATAAATISDPARARRCEMEERKPARTRMIRSIRCKKGFRTIFR